ncbi:helix-turn-helix domain-containing protein [Pedobacter sp.]
MQFGSKIKELRLKRGYSIQVLADLAGVSKPAIQQYEDDTITPSNMVLKKIADALGVGVWHFFPVKRKKISLIDFRDGHRLLDEQKEKDAILDIVRDEAQKYIDLLFILQERVEFENPLTDMVISTFADVEKAAKKFRKKLKIGEAPIDDVTGILEANGFIILTVNRPTHSPGVCGLIEDDGKSFPVIIYNEHQDREVTRKRFTILHELAHLVLIFMESLSKDIQEQMCHYFASAMLLPEDALISFVGKGRTSISFQELVELKETYGISIQAIIFRAKNIGMITDETKRKWLDIYESWQQTKNFGAYTKSQEKPKRFESLIARAIVERRITKEKAMELTGTPIDMIEDRYLNKSFEF